ncbi:hypothetical protein BDY19DRAFT_996899 [Irpex rosettiformis]|uniref:Uncharacterized protein n=1 Tax=Irpex rosettiformis TaxID=378272 RepID=A0ACB8TTN0_9APHY|nr:hypothetical protein BDY19DRAFT_996899 [Irpex rosettiformis]
MAVHKAVLSPPNHYIISTITAAFLLASYTTTISFSWFAGMYKPVSEVYKDSYEPIVVGPHPQHTLTIPIPQKLFR